MASWSWLDFVGPNGSRFNFTAKDWNGGLSRCFLLVWIFFGKMLLGQLFESNSPKSMPSMEQEILDFLAPYITLTDEEIQSLAELNMIRHCKKGTILLEEGQTAVECYFILKGCVRKYFLIEGEEKTTEFYTEKQPVKPVSFVKGGRSEYYLACLEDCILSIGNNENSEALGKKNPRFEALGNLISNDQLAESQIALDNYMNLSPEGRYLNLIETRPHLLNRVPQYMLASYLGVRPESLSRIRRRLQKEQPSNQ